MNEIVDMLYQKKIISNKSIGDIILSGHSRGEQFIADTWKDFMIGNLKFRAVKLCSRCVITTVNQDTAEKGSEPLETLAKFRRIGNKVMFGQNVIGYDAGVVKVGDQIVSLEI